MSRAGILRATDRRWNTSDSPFNHLYTVFQKSAEMFCTRSSSFEQQQSLMWAAKTEEEQIKSHLCIIYFEETLIFLLVLQLKGERKVINTSFLYILCCCASTILTDVLLLVLLSPDFHSAWTNVAGCHSATVVMNSATQFCFCGTSVKLWSPVSQTTEASGNHVDDSHSSSLGFI